MGKTVRSLLRSGRLTGLGLAAGERLVLIVLIDHADDDGIAWPVERTIALESGMQRSSVQKQLPALVARGVIELVEEGGPRRSARYRVSPELWTTGLCHVGVSVMAHWVVQKEELLTEHALPWLCAPSPALAARSAR